MRIVAVKDDFRCAVLEGDDLEAFFAAKRLSYTDDNPECDHNRDAILAAIESEGLDYFSEIFDRDGGASFVLLNAHDQIQGSAELDYDDDEGVADFESSHIHSSLRGQRLIDLFYEARENYIRQHTACSTIQLTTRPDNAPSQKAAIRNGFVKTSSVTKAGHFIFEKTL